MTFSSNGASADEHVHDVLNHRSGPAGFTAGLYAARANLNPILFTGQEYGGQVSLTYEIENYPGFPEALGGPELVERMKLQAERFGLKVEFDYVTELDVDEHPFTLRTEAGKVYRTRSVIATTGARPRYLHIPGEEELTGRGVSYCATCDGFFFRDKDVCGGRRRRQRLGRGVVPDQVRQPRPGHPPARRIPGLQDPAGPGHEARQGGVPAQQGGDFHSRRR